MEEESTLIVIKMGDRTTSVEIAGTDLSANEMIEAFYGAMVAQTFLPETVLDCMRSFVYENIDYATLKETECQR
jgi:hypothetical protein